VQNLQAQCNPLLTESTDRILMIENRPRLFEKVITELLRRT